MRLSEGVSIWPNAVIRAESQYVAIGPRSNVQDFVMIHVGYQTPTVVGADCSITHHVTLHGCQLGDNVLVGIGATVMDGAVIGRNSIVAGGAFITERMVFPDNAVIMGVPAKLAKTRDCGAENIFNAWLYECNARGFLVGNYRVWQGEDFVKASAQKRRELGLEG